MAGRNLYLIKLKAANSVFICLARLKYVNKISNPNPSITLTVKVVLVYDHCILLAK